MTLPLRFPIPLRIFKFNSVRHCKMSSSALVSKLSSPLRDLVLSATPNDEDFGTSEKDKSEVSNWISKVAQGDIVKPDSAKVSIDYRPHPPSHSYKIKELDVTLTPRTYLVNNTLTAADVALYGALHPTLVRELILAH